MTEIKNIRFRDVQQLEKTNQVTELLNTILLSLSSSVLLSVNPLDHRISIELCHLFDFQSMEEMIDYIQLLIKDRDKQMNIYAQIYANKYHGNHLPPHQFNRFAIALEQLFKEKRLLSISIRPH